MQQVTKYPNPSSSDVLNIQARPDEHEALIRRQGQSARIIQVRKCPCIKHGNPDLFCVVCKGKGYMFEFQKTKIILDENSDHCGNWEIRPFGTPVIRGISVVKRMHVSQGGDYVYNIVSNDAEKITISGLYPPRKYDWIQCSYEYGLEKEVFDEDSLHETGSFYLHTTGTKVYTFANISNPNNIQGTLTEVSRVHNVTQNYTYNVLSFNKQTIVLDTESGSAPIPQLSDIFQVDYKYLPPMPIGTARMDLKAMQKKWGDDIKEGDVNAIIPGGIYTTQGDIITFLYPRIKSTIVMTRGTGNKDELPQFDVAEIQGEIIDEDGTIYDNTKFYLAEYNDLIWKTGQGPTAGKKYSVKFLYNPSYRVYRQEIDIMTNENRRFPGFCLIRFMNRFDKKELIVQ